MQPERVITDDDGVAVFEHPLGALLDYTVDLVNDPSGSWLGSATLAAQGVAVSPTPGLVVGNGATQYTPPTPPGGAAITPAAPQSSAGRVTVWIWTAAGVDAPAVGSIFTVDLWARTTGPERVSRARFRIRIT